VPDVKIENIMFDSALNNSEMLSRNDQQVIIAIDYRIPTIARSIRLSLKATE
jgi:hypothetical protein